MVLLKKIGIKKYIHTGRVKVAMEHFTLPAAESLLARCFRAGDSLVEAELTLSPVMFTENGQ